MKWQVIAIMIILYWIFLGTLLTNVSADADLFGTANIGGNQSFEIPFDVNDVNVSNVVTSGENSMRSFPEAMKIMWTFQTPSSGFPKPMSDFIALINWMLVILFGTALYRILNPLAATA